MFDKNKHASKRGSRERGDFIQNERDSQPLSLGTDILHAKCKDQNTHRQMDAYIVKCFNAFYPIGKVLRLSPNLLVALCGFWLYGKPSCSLSVLLQLTHPHAISSRDPRVQPGVRHTKRAFHRDVLAITRVSLRAKVTMLQII